VRTFRSAGVPGRPKGLHFTGLRASKLLHHVLAYQRLPRDRNGFLIQQPHRIPARGVLRATAAVVRRSRARESRA
jgi:hypothetical protein